jgi:hypothetical protein
LVLLPASTCIGTAVPSAAAKTTTVLPRFIYPQRQGYSRVPRLKPFPDHISEARRIVTNLAMLPDLLMGGPKAKWNIDG